MCFYDSAIVISVFLLSLIPVSIIVPPLSLRRSVGDANDDDDGEVLILI